MERRPSDLPARVTYTLPMRKVTWKDENEYLNLEPTAPPLLTNTSRRNSFDNKLDSDLTQVKVLKHKTKDQTKPLTSASDIRREIEQPFWCKGCTVSTPDRLVRGRWTLCTQCQLNTKWCKKCWEQDSYVLVQKGYPCSLCNTREKDFPCTGCVDTHPGVSITFVEKRSILCQICTSHGLVWCFSCGHSFNGRNGEECPKCIVTHIQQAQSPKKIDKSSQSSDCEQGVLLIKESKQVNGKEDKKCKRSYKCIVQ